MSPLVLSSRGLERGASVTERDFAFIGKSCTVQCTRFQAAFISPRVHALLQEDRTLDSCCLEFESHNGGEKRIFEFLEQLVKGVSTDSRDSERDWLVELAAFLGNDELLDQLLNNKDPINKSTVCSRLRGKAVLGRPIGDEIEFAARHFYALDIEGLKGIDVSILEKILSSPELCLRNEDSLVDFICNADLEGQSRFGKASSSDIYAANT
jgi:hypothetical protein